MRTRALPMLALGSLALCLVAGCRRSATTPSAADPDARLTQAPPGAVLFDLQALPLAGPAKGAVLHVQATYRARGATSHFRVWLPLKAPAAGEPAAFTTVGIFRDPASDPSALLADLARALHAKDVPAPAAAKRTDKLWVSAAILGQNLSPSASTKPGATGFTTEPAGHWVVTKLFLADGQGEVYLNLNPKSGQGMFMMKAPEYGGEVVRELAKVL